MEPIVPTIIVFRIRVQAMVFAPSMALATVTNVLAILDFMVPHVLLVRVTRCM